jgi:hypothetical protein
LFPVSWRHGWLLWTGSQLVLRLREKSVDKVSFELKDVFCSVQYSQ